MIKRSTFSLMIFLKKRKSGNEEKSIYARITVNGKAVELSLQQFIDPRKWDQKLSRSKGRSVRDKTINRTIELLETRIQSIRNDIITKGEEVTALKVKQEFLGITPTKETLIELFVAHNTRQQELVPFDCAPGTAERYRTCLMHVKDFMDKDLGIKDIEFKDLGFEFALGFEKYLKVERNCAHNTAMKYYTNLKKIVNLARAKRIIDYDPFLAFKVKLDKVDIGYLTKQELETIENKNFNIERVQQVKDVFVFCCYTGLAYSDVKKLNHSNLLIDDNNLKWIKIARQKTKSISKIPLLPQANQILNRYKNNPKCLVEGRLLPVLSNQKMNAYLKEIADLCGIDKNLCTHHGRNVFGTTVTLANKIPIETVSKMLGHADLNMTKKYARITDSKIANDMELLIHKT